MRLDEFRPRIEAERCLFCCVPSRSVHIQNFIEVKRCAVREYMNAAGSNHSINNLQHTNNIVMIFNVP